MRTESDLEEALEHLVEGAPQGSTFMTDLRRERSRRRRRTRGLVIGGVSLVVASVAAIVSVLSVGPVRQVAVPAVTPVPTVSGSPGAVLPPDRGTWTLTHRVDPPTGWRVMMIFATSTSEATRVAPSDDPDNQDCEVTFYTPEGDRPPDVRFTTVLAGVPGRLSQGSRNESAEFWWSPRRGSWASVSCVGMKDPKAAIVSMLKGISREQQAIRLPFTLSSLPAKFRVVTASQGFAPGYPSGIEVGDDRREPGLHGASLAATSRVVESSPGARIEQLTVAGHAAVLVVPQPFTGEAQLCLTDDSSAVRICATTTPQRLRVGTPDTEAEARERLLTIMELVQPAADLNDPQTWPSAGRLPG